MNLIVDRIAWLGNRVKRNGSSTNWTSAWKWKLLLHALQVFIRGTFVLNTGISWRKQALLGRYNRIRSFRLIPCSRGYFLPWAELDFHELERSWRIFHPILVSATHDRSNLSVFSFFFLFFLRLSHYRIIERERDSVTFILLRSCAPNSL